LSEVKKLFKSSLHLFTGQISTNLLTIGFTIFFAHALSKKEFSAIAIFAILLGLTNMLSNFGLETNCLREIPFLINKKSHHLAAAMLKTTIFNRLLWSSLIALAVFIGSDYLANLFFRDPGYSGIIKIISLGLLFGSLNTSFELLGQSLKIFKQIAVIKFVNALSYCLVAIILYSLIGFKGWVIGYSWSRIFGILLYIIILFKWFKIPSGLYSWPRLVKTSLSFYLRGYVRFGSVQLDQLVIGIFMEPSVLATYYVAKRLSSTISMIIDAVGRPLLIKIAELKSVGKEKAAEALGKISRYNSFLFVPICLGVIAFGQPLLELYGGSKYLNAYPLLIILCLATLMRGVGSSVYISGVFILGTPKQTLYVDTAGCVVNTIFLVILVPLLDTTGVALSVLFSTTASIIMAYFILNKQIKIIFDKSTFVRMFLATCIMSGIVIFLQSFNRNLAIIPFYGSTFLLVLILYIIRLLEPKDITILENIFSGNLIIIMKILYLCGIPKTNPNRSER